MKYVIIPLIFLFSSLVYGQAWRHLGGQTIFGDYIQPDGAAIFQVESTEGGFLPPRLSEGQRDALEAAHDPLPVGLQIFNTDSLAIESWNGFAWVSSLGGVVGSGEEECIPIWEADETPILINSLLCTEGGKLFVQDSENALLDIPLTLAGQNDGGVVAEDLLEVSGRLEVNSTEEASKPCPDMTQAQRDNIASPGAADCIYNTTIDNIEVFDGSEWILVGGAGGLDPWEGEYPYEVGDVVFVEFQGFDRIFVANADHTSDTTDFSEDITNWDLLADASVTILDGEINVEADFNLDGDMVIDGVLTLQEVADCSTITPTTGKIFYCGDLDLLRYFDSSGLITNIGEDLFTRARNTSGSTIPKGAIVRSVGATGGNPNIQLAALGDITSQQTVGVAKQDINDNAIGKISLVGRVRDLDTSAFTVGDILYLSESTPGQFTTTPTLVKIGRVLNSNDTEGSVLVDIDIDQDLSGFVDGPEESTNNAVSLWDGTSGRLLKDSTLSYDDGDLVIDGDLFVDDVNLSEDSNIRYSGDMDITSSSGTGSRWTLRSSLDPSQGGGLAGWGNSASFRPGSIRASITNTNSEFDIIDDTGSQLFVVDTDGNVNVTGDLEVIGNADLLGNVNVNNIQGGNIQSADIFKDPFFHRGLIGECSDVEDCVAALEGTTEADTILADTSQTVANFFDEGSYAVALLGEGACYEIEYDMVDAQKTAQLLKSIYAIDLFDSGEPDMVRTNIEFGRGSMTVFDSLVSNDWAVHGHYFVNNDDTGFIRFCPESSDTDEYSIVAFHKPSLKPTALETIRTRNCVGGLDCINEFSAIVHNEGNLNEVAQESPGDWIDSCTGSDPSVCSFVEGIFSEAPRCTATGADTLGNGRTNIDISSDSDGFTVWTSRTQTIGDAPDRRRTSVKCTRVAGDYKPDHERGVVASDGNTDARLTVSHPTQGSDITVGNATITVPFADVIDSNLIEWNDSTNEATFKKGGWFQVFYNLVAINLSTETGFETFVEVDSGSGFAIPDTATVIGGEVNSSNARVPNHTGFAHIRVNKGDKMRLRFRGIHSATNIYSRETSTITMQITPSVTGQQILGLFKNIPDMPRADSEQIRFCILSQESDTSSPIFTSDSDCADFSEASRTSAGRYSPIKFKSGYFKSESNVRCYTGAWDFGVPWITSDFDSTVEDPSAFIREDKEFQVRTRDLTSNPAAFDSPWSLFCVGPRP